MQRSDVETFLLSSLDLVRVAPPLRPREHTSSLLNWQSPMVAMGAVRQLALVCIGISALVITRCLLPLPCFKAASKTRWLQVLCHHAERQAESGPGQPRRKGVLLLPH